MPKKHSKIVSLILTLIVIAAGITPVYADTTGLTVINTGIKKSVYAVGQYRNWDGVPNVSQFTDEKGQPAFAYKVKKQIRILKTRNGKISKKLNLKMDGSVFGTVACDASGYFYAVTGKKNTGSDTSVNTVFITKYDAAGNLIESIGDNGRASLAYYFDNSFNTKIPFDAGTCSIAINGKYLAVNYGRQMYSGHQSNSVWMIDTETMTSVKPSSGFTDYQSHSFGQRTIPFGGGFAFMSEGDCYDRAFTFSSADFATGRYIENTAIFDFWVEKGAFSRYDMHVVNDNFAQMGDICDIGNGTVAFVASSVKSMDENAEKEHAQIFIQIFDPLKGVGSEYSFVTSGTRSGLAGKNGDESKTNYGIKWLTNYSAGYVDNPQAVTDGQGNTIVLFERYNKKNNYMGVYVIKVDPVGEVIQPAKRISKKATLNACATPVYSKGCVYWCSNNYYDSNNKLMIYKLKI